MRSKNNLRVSFFLKKAKLPKNGEASVAMRITVDGQRVENNIRKSILTNLWDQSKERAKGTSAAAVTLTASLRMHASVSIRLLQNSSRRELKSIR